MKKCNLNRYLLITFATAILTCYLYGQYGDRDSWQQPDKIMDAVGITAGMTIGEAGAGYGYFIAFHYCARLRAGDGDREVSGLPAAAPAVNCEDFDGFLIFI